MEVYLDGAAVQVPEKMPETVGDLVGQVAAEIDSKRRVIGVSLNGEDITGQRERHLEPMPEDGKLELTTGLASALALDTLGSIEEFHAALLKELSRASDEFRMGSFEKANDVFARCMDGLQVLLNTTLSVASLLQVEVEEIQTGEQTLADNTGKISRILDELIEAQTNRDGILIADLVEYELNPLLEDWAGAVTSLKSIGEKA